LYVACRAWQGTCSDMSLIISDSAATDTTSSSFENDLFPAAICYNIFRSVLLFENSARRLCAVYSHRMVTAVIEPRLLR
jgi:hypothetical protein